MVVTQSDGRVLAFERSDVPGAWQLPQGGLDEGEPVEEAAWRELREETGLTAAHVDLVAEYHAWLGYELPVESRSTKTGRGQVHRWFHFRMRDDVSVPELPGNQGEFRGWLWMSMADLAAGAVDFRQPVYRLLERWLDRASG